MLASTEERECGDSLTLMASSSVPDWNPPFDKSSYDPENFITQWFKSTAGKYHEFILDTASRESVISLGNLKLFFPSAKLRPATRIVKCAMHQRIPFLGTAMIPIYSASGKPINCEFHISEDSSYSLIGLKVIRELGVSVCLLLPSSTTSHEEINKLLTTCDNATGGMTIDPIHLEAEGDPIFLKRRILPYGLREPVHKELMKLQNEGTIRAVNSSL